MRRGKLKLSELLLKRRKDIKTMNKNEFKKFADDQLSGSDFGTPEEIYKEYNQILWDKVYTFLYSKYAKAVENNYQDPQQNVKIVTEFKKLYADYSSGYRKNNIR